MKRSPLSTIVPTAASLALAAAVGCSSNTAPPGATGSGASPTPTPTSGAAAPDAGDAVELPSQDQADAAAREQINDDNADAAFDDLLKEVEDDLSDDG